MNSKKGFFTYTGLIEKPFLVLPTLPRLTSYTLRTMYKVRYFYCCAALQD